MPNKKELYPLMTASALCLLFFLLVLTLLPQPKIKDNWVIGATQFDSELGWIPLPNVVVHLFNQAYIQHNSLGFRSDELSSKPTILIVGDSIVWGYGVSNNETVTYYLKEALLDFQVLNPSQTQSLKSGLFLCDETYDSFLQYLMRLKPLIASFD